MDPAVTAIVSSLVTGLLVVAGSAVGAWLSGRATVAATERRVRAEFLSTRRQEWVDSLRDHLAEWMSRANRLQVEEDKDSIADDPDSKVDIQRLALLRHKIDLMLSAHDKEHMELSKALEDATNAAIAGDAENYFSILTLIRDKARSITKYAWEQAKDDIG